MSRRCSHWQRDASIADDILFLIDVQAIGKKHVAGPNVNAIGSIVLRKRGPLKIPDISRTDIPM